MAKPLSERSVQNIEEILGRVKTIEKYISKFAKKVESVPEAPPVAVPSFSLSATEGEKPLTRFDIPSVAESASSIKKLRESMRRSVDSGERKNMKIVVMDGNGVVVDSVDGVNAMMIFASTKVPRLKMGGVQIDVKDQMDAEGGVAAICSGETHDLIRILEASKKTGKIIIEDLLRKEGKHL